MKPVNVVTCTLCAAACWTILSTPGWAASTITHDGSLGTAGAVNPAGNLYTILQNNGRTSGSNLFHSFGQFNVGSGDTARFQSSGINNIISRVTGGDSSAINGTIGAAANLYLINPGGIVFGRNASLDVNGSFHASTAHYMRFSGGERFYADTVNTSQYVAANPAAFGFLGAPASIQVNGSALTVPVGERLSLVGGQVALNNAALFVKSGTLTVVGLGGSGEVVLAAAGPQLEQVSQLGDITITRDDGADVVDLEVSGSEGDGDLAPRAGGAIHIVGHTLTVTDATLKGDSHAESASATSGGIHITLSGDMVLTENGSISADALGQGPGGDIHITAGNDITTEGVIFADSYSSGHGGNITLEAGHDVAIGYAGYITTDAVAQGAGGNISVTAGNDILVDGTLFADSYDQGAGGNITLESGNDIDVVWGFVTTDAYGTGHGGSILFHAGHDIYFDSTLFADSYESGHGGSITLQADNDVVVDNYGYITTDTYGPGGGGSIHVTAGRDVTLHGELTAQAGNWSDPDYEGDVGAIVGDGGSVTVTAGHDITVGKGTITADTYSAGHGGSVTLTAANNILVDYSGTITTDSLGQGTGGGVFMNAGHDVAVDGKVFADSYDIGHGGNIVVDAGNDIKVLYGFVTTDAYSGGDGGSITMNAGNDIVIDSKVYADTHETGHGGKINLWAARDIDIGYYAYITTDSMGSGSGGGVEVNAGRDLRMDGWIFADTYDSGTGGNVILQAARDIVMVGDQEGSAWVSSDAMGSGNGGAVSVQAGRSIILDGAWVSSDAKDTGHGGNLHIAADSGVHLIHGAWISADSAMDEPEVAAGSAGNILITANDRLQVDHSAITAESVRGGGGNIEVRVGHLIHLNNATLLTSVGSGAADAGNIYIDPDLFVINQSTISANADAGAGGSVILVAQSLLMDQTSVLSATSNSGVQGTVETRAPDMDITENIAVLPASFFDASGLLKEVCGAAARQGIISSFILSGRGGMPSLPEDVVASPTLLLQGESTTTLGAVASTRMQLAALPGVSLECLML